MADHLDFGQGMTPAPADAAIRDTYLGQAHIAGTGPQGKTCRECAFWHAWKTVKDGDGNSSRKPCHPTHFSKKHAQAGEIKKARCNRPILNKAKRAIPHHARACRLFVESDAPPAAKIDFKASN